MTEIISFTQYKGGCAKTTSTLNTGFYLASKGKKVLLVDIDPQAHLTYSLGISEDSVEDNNIYNSLVNNEKLNILNLKNYDSGKVDLIPSHIDLELAYKQLYSDHVPFKKLKKLLDSIKNNYDYILIDCPPSLNMLTQNALYASDSVLIPVQSEALSCKGLSKLISAIDDLKEAYEINLAIKGIFLTRYDSRKVLNKQMFEFIKEEYPDEILETVIRENISLAETPLAKQDIFSYAPDSNGAKDYESLVKEVFVLQ